MILKMSYFYLLQIGWFVFGTLVSFSAALLFWNKGSAAVKGQLFENEKTVYKFTGAGAIFIATLALFKWINPVLPISDYKRLEIIHSGKNITELDYNSFKDVNIKIYREDSFWENFDPDQVAVEMIPTKYLFNLHRTIDGRGLTTRDKVPKGKYLIRTIRKDEGTYTQGILEIN